jgi:predicted nuclease of predicted toxin-antitoxin system
MGMARASDAAIVQEARRNREVIVTHDLDYGRILFFESEARCSVVIFRLRNTHPDKVFSRLMNSWIEIEKPLVEGAIVVPEDAALRVRRSAPA